MKILITGALGYIGTELCKSYFGTKNQIIAIDKRFFSDRVTTLQNNNINFIQGDVLDENLISSIIKDVDLVYHLAGTTDVAYTKFNSNDDKDIEIRKNGIDATRIILKYIPKTAKLVFPSTHVVYEGLPETTLNIEEDFPTKPYLTYAQTKNQSEIDIKESNVEYIILRLGSVYGYSSDTMRMNIMPNLFSKIASQNGEITLFSGGLTHKSLVSVLDVVRALRFFGDSEIKNETYHLTNENISVKDVSTICKLYNPKVKIKTTESEISLGYSPDYNLSNQKLLSTGFEFKYNIQESVREMIYNWSSTDIRKYIDGFKTKCRVSDSDNLINVVSLGLSPLANNLINEKDEQTDFYPLDLVYCPESHNVQLNYVVEPEKMFKNYLYVSSTTKTFREHFEKAALSYIENFELDSNSLVIDIGSNDGIALLPLKNNGIKVLGIEPAENISKIAKEKGIETICQFFSNKTADLILEKYNSADLVLASNVFAHSDEIDEITLATTRILKDNGSFIIEVQYLVDTIRDLTFDNIYHEHVNYWTVHSLISFFSKFGLKVYKVEHINTHGGSIRVYSSKNPKEIEKSVNTFIKEEEEFGITNVETYIDFGKRIVESKNNVLKNLEHLKKLGSSIVGYGAPAKATTTLNFYGITDKDIDFIVEDNKLKHDKFVPGTGIQIFSKEKLNEKLPDVILVFAWNFIEEIKSNNLDLINRGVKFYSIKELQSLDFQKKNEVNS